MKINSIDRTQIYFVDVYDVDIHGNKVLYEYIRFNDNNWMMRYGESYELILYNEEKEL